MLQLNDLFAKVMANDADSLCALFSGGHPNVNVPAFGVVSNDRIFRLFLKKVATHFGKLGVVADLKGVKAGAGVLLAEYLLHYDFYDWERDKTVVYQEPAAVLCDLDESGKITLMTVYVGTDSFVGHMVTRTAFRNVDPSITLPAAVQAVYDAEADKVRVELCRLFASEGWIACEENVLMTRGDICTPQPRLSVFTLNSDGTVAERACYGDVVWDFKLWATHF